MMVNLITDYILPLLPDPGLLLLLLLEASDPEPASSDCAGLPDTRSDAVLALGWLTHSHLPLVPTASLISEGAACHAALRKWLVRQARQSITRSIHSPDRVISHSHASVPSPVRAARAR